MSWTTRSHAPIARLASVADRRGARRLHAEGVLDAQAEQKKSAVIAASSRRAPLVDRPVIAPASVSADEELDDLLAVVLAPVVAAACRARATPRMKASRCAASASPRAAARLALLLALDLHHHPLVAEVVPPHERLRRHVRHRVVVDARAARRSRRRRSWCFMAGLQRPEAGLASGQARGGARLALAARGTPGHKSSEAAAARGVQSSVPVDAQSSRSAW